MLIGDFNAHTTSKHVPFFDRGDPSCWKIDTRETELARTSHDTAPCTVYGENLLALGGAHGLAIFIGLPRWLGSEHLTCLQLSGRSSSTVDYLMGPPSLIPSIQDIHVSTHPIRVATDHAYLAFSLVTHIDPSQPALFTSSHPRYHSPCETTPYYATKVFDGVMDLNPCAPLATLTGH